MSTKKTGASFYQKTKKAELQRLEGDWGQGEGLEWGLFICNCVFTTSNYVKFQLRCPGSMHLISRTVVRTPFNKPFNN